MALGGIILTSAEITDLQNQIAPGTADSLTSIIEVWRKPIVPDGSVPGGAGVDDVYGAPLEEGNEQGRPDQRFEKVAEYPARITRAGVGSEKPFGPQFVAVAPWTVTFNWQDNPDITAADKLLVQVEEWNASETIVAGDVRQPSVSNGRSYIATTSGVTGTVEPTWPISYASIQDDTATVTDGGVVWVHEKYLRTFEVKDAAGRTTFNVVRLVRCEEIIG